MELETFVCNFRKAIEAAPIMVMIWVIDGTMPGLMQMAWSSTSQEIRLNVIQPL